MLTLVDAWSRPQSGSSAIAQAYYVGRGALAHQDWHTAQAAFADAEVQLRDHAEWQLRWYCLVGLTTLAWRAEDSAATLHWARELLALADRIDGSCARIWSMWLLGHIYAGHYQWAEAAACFTSIAYTLETLPQADDEAQRSLQSLTAVARMYCVEAGADPASSLVQIFGIVQLSLKFGLKHGLPLEALQGLAGAPQLTATTSPASKQPTGPFEWILNILQRKETSVAPSEEPQHPPVEVLSAEPQLAEELEIAEEDQQSTYDLRAYCLGRFEIWVGHQLMTQWNGAKSTTLLKLLLAAFPQMVPATKLMEAIWPGVEEELARQRLHTAISDLRRVLRAGQPEQSQFVVAQNGCYGLDPHIRIWIDTLTFAKALRAGYQYEQLGRTREAQASFHTAVALYRGDFLVEDTYEDWPTDQRERLKNEYLMALAHLSKQAFTHEDYAACVSWGRLTLECDPCREDTHRLMMRCYSRLGQRTSALRQYRQCVEALRRELDAVPEAESDELYRKLQQGLEI